MTRLVGSGVRVLGVGSAVPSRVLTNADLEKMMDTSDEWITQRTGIRERRVVDPDSEGTFTLSTQALQSAMDSAGVTPGDLDLLILATVSGEMSCPSVACRVAAAIGAVPMPAFDVTAACSGFVYSMNIADAILASGRFRTIGVIGCDTMSTIVDYSDRSVSILFGDAAGAAILQRDEGSESGQIVGRMYADGSDWSTLYIPRRPHEIPQSDRDNPIKLGCLRMHGREIFKFAVTQMRALIEETLKEAGLTVDDVDHFICHQSNRRILESAKEKLGIPDEKMYINIDRYGNSSAGSVGLCFGELWQSGKIQPGQIVLLVAIGGGMTWASSLWRI